MCADVGRGRGRGRGRGLSQERPRPPKTSTVDNSPILEAVPPSSVQAAQTPATPPAARTSTQNSILELYVNAKEFVPRSSSALPSFVATVEQRPSRLSLHHISTSTKRLRDRNAVIAEDRQMLQHLEETVCILATYNESFLDVIESLTNTLKAWVVDERALETVVERLFEEAVCNPNFRYIGVRMGDYIDQHLTARKPGMVLRYRSTLLKICRDEHKRFEKVEIQEKERARWFGFSLFLGEVYCQVQVKGKPYAVVGRGCMDNIQWLLKNGQPDALFVAFSLFKLTGPLMDSDVDLKQRIDKCVVDMQIILDNLGDTQSIHRQLLEVGKRTLKLRAHHWENVASPAASPAQKRKLSASASDQALVRQDSGYGLASPAGERYPSATAAAEVSTPVDPRHYSGEQLAFGGYPEELAIDGYPEELMYSAAFPSFSDEWAEYMPTEYETADMWYPGDEMPDEVEAAFEQFLQEQGK